MSHLYHPSFSYPAGAVPTFWLASHNTAAVRQPGWTYMFEAVYHDNVHVVPYPFEGLVLLGAVLPQVGVMNALDQTVV